MATVERSRAAVEVDECPDWCRYAFGREEPPKGSHLHMHPSWTRMSDVDYTDIEMRVVQNYYDERATPKVSVAFESTSASWERHVLTMTPDQAQLVAMELVQYAARARQYLAADLRRKARGR